MTLQLHLHEPAGRESPLRWARHFISERRRREQTMPSPCLLMFGAGLLNNIVASLSGSAPLSHPTGATSQREITRIDGRGGLTLCTFQASGRAASRWSGPAITVDLLPHNESALRFPSIRSGRPLTVSNGGGIPGGVSQVLIVFSLSPLSFLNVQQGAFHIRQRFISSMRWTFWPAHVR